MIRIDIKKRFEKLVVFLFKIKYIGLYFWSTPSTAKDKSIHLVIGDLLTIFVFLLTIVVVFLIKLGIIPSDISVKEISNARIIALSILGAFALLIAKLITNKIIKIIEIIYLKAINYFLF